VNITCEILILNKPTTNLLHTMSSSTGGGGDGKQPASQHTIPPPKTSGAATGGQQLSASANQFVDKIDPFSKRGNSRRRRRLVGSSRYHTDNEPDLVQLQMLKG
jgi:hypothetical protein